MPKEKSQILRSFEQLRASGVIKDQVPDIVPGKTFVIPLSGVMKGNMGIVISHSLKGNKYSVGFLRGKWKDIKDLPAADIPGQCLNFRRDSLEIVP